ncbi:MAG TPA: hypothetical protein VJO53_05145 [Candidatus Acidoferrales bacterium]|nr:hypothetical protein [Candidatus Acidoferrales bacterium]
MTRRLPMPNIKPVALATLLLLAGIVRPLSAQLSNLQASDEACRNFVQSFYDWYAPNLLDDSPYESAIDRVLESGLLSPDLARELKEVTDTEAKSGGDIWLGVDPIVHSEDLWEKFVARSVTRQGDHYFVEIHGVSSEKKDDSADVVAELVFQTGRWIFVNFHYPGYLESSGNENLLSVLRRLRRSIYEPDSPPKGARQ